MPKCGGYARQQSNLNLSILQIKQALYYLLVMADIKHGVAGGLAGIAVDTIFYPLQVIKTRIMGSTPNENFNQVARNRFKGFSCQMIVSFPYSFAFFYVYETTRKLLQDYYLKNVIASVLAEITGNLIRNPFQIIKQQLIVGRSDRIVYSLRQILNKKGPSGFYIGLGPTLARDTCFSGIQLPLFQLFRGKNYLKLDSVASAAVSGAMAAIIAAFLTCPLDVIKTRIMTQNFKITGAKNIIGKIYAQSGLGGFFKGVAFRCGILSFGGVIYFGALQKTRNLLGIGQAIQNQYSRGQ